MFRNGEEGHTGAILPGQRLLLTNTKITRSQESRHGEVHIGQPIQRLNLPVSRTDLSDRGLTVLRSPGHPFASSPDTRFDTVVADILGEGEGDDGRVMLHHTSKEGFLLARRRDGDVGVGGAASSFGVRTGVEGCTETVLGGDVGDGLAGFQEGVDGGNGGGGREDEFELGGGGFGVELLEVDVDGGEGVDDFFEEREESLVVGGHSGPGVVADCWEVFAFAFAIGGGLQEHGFDFESEFDVDVVLEFEFVGQVLQRRSWTSF